MSEPYQETRRCDTCDQEYWPGPGVVELPFGVFCSTACADRAEAEFTERMARKGFMVWDHESQERERCRR